jgi:hypothetical protein
MSTLAEQPVIEFVQHELRPSRMKGTVSVRFDRDHHGRRRIKFGGENYGDDEAEEVTINGKLYRMCAAVVEESPGLWKADRGYDTLRVPGSMAKGTDNARAAVRDEIQSVAPAYAEKHSEKFDETTAHEAGKTVEGYIKAAEDAEAQAKLLREQAELLGWIRDGIATVRPWYARGRRLVMDFGAEQTTAELAYVKASGRAEVVAHIVIDGDIVGYMGEDMHRRIVYVTAGQVLEMRDR